LEISYWQEELEKIDRKSLQELQLQLLQQTIARAFKTPFYSQRLTQAGIKSPQDIKTLDDLQKIPFTTKDDLRKAYPFGLLGVEIKDVVRIHTSSGTTGKPTVIYHTRKDIDNWADLVARCIVMTGCSQEDVFQNMMSYGLFTGGLGLHYGAERVGMMVIPAGGGNTKRQLQLMKDFGTTVIHVTPSYILHIADKIKELGFKREELKLKRGFLGAEPYSESTRKKIEKIMEIDVYNSYGLSEMNGPGVAFECVYKEGMHVWEDAYIMEVINPHTGEVLPPGEEGELVFTTLQREATPLLRYRTRDLAVIYPDGCKCGRTHRRISRIKGRTDDMLIINGVNVFPSQIEEVLMANPDIGGNYQIYIEKAGYLDKLTVKVEIKPEIFHGDIRELENLKERLREDLKASIVINPSVELLEPGSLPPWEGKAKRVVDNRSKL
jgi:phenylacetate-CoA ligase